MWTNVNQHSVFTSYVRRLNGWTATVVDDTMLHAPFRGTRYHVSAICRWWSIGHPETFLTLDEARAVALEFTDAMPKTFDSAPSGYHCSEAWIVQEKYRAAWREKREAAE